MLRRGGTCRLSSNQRRSPDCGAGSRCERLSLGDLRGRGDRLISYWGYRRNWVYGDTHIRHSWLSYLLELRLRLSDTLYDLRSSLARLSPLTRLWRLGWLGRQGLRSLLSSEDLLLLCQVVGSRPLWQRRIRRHIPRRRWLPLLIAE